MIQKITTERVKINNTGSGMPEALSMTEKAAGLLHLAAKDSLRARLLAEETLSMVKAVTGQFSADFWIEVNEEDRTFAIHLEAKSELDYPKRQELLSVSTTGKNTAHTGIMDKIPGRSDVPVYGDMGITMEGKPLYFSKDFLIYLPKGTPDEAVAELDAAVAQMQADPQFQEDMAKMTYSGNTLQSKEAKEFIYAKRDDIKKVLSEAPNIEDLE